MNTRLERLVYHPGTQTSTLRKESTLLFMIHYQVNDERISINRFLKWTPPFEFKGHWAAADGKTGFALVEAASPAAIFETSATFMDCMDFDVHAILEIGEAVPLLQKAIAWADRIDEG